MKLGMVITVVKIVLLKLHLKIERNNMDKMKDMFELRNAVRHFLEDKLEAKNKLKKLKIELIDAPVSGTGAQAKLKDLVVMSSGLKSVVSECEDIFNSFARKHMYVGSFGNGIKFKILANLLVTVHNTVTAEALLLGQKAGLDENMIYNVLNAGAATSVMLDKRMPLMINKQYEPATASMRIFLKDIPALTLVSNFLQIFACKLSSLGPGAELLPQATEIRPRAALGPAERVGVRSVLRVSFPHAPFPRSRFGFCNILFFF